jgi:pyruvate formate lyase activating enzyme
MIPARLYKAHAPEGEPTGKIQCLLCGHRCILDNQRLGVCKVRKNIDGVLYSLNYHKVAATHADPIEKKPLYHFLPASISYSVATMGCNFTCKFCQNNSLSVVHGEQFIYGEPITPEQLVKNALGQGAQSISYTYSEPTIYFELMYETAVLARKNGIKNIMVTNGYMSPEALQEISPYMDAANVDLKAYSDEFYKKYCGARLEPVLETIRGMKDAGLWIELTTLLIPGLNDDPGEIKELISFIGDVDETIPWHVSRFFPQHQLTDVPPTDPGDIFKYLETGEQMGLKYLYGGNVSSRQWEDTRCPECQTVLVERSGYSTRVKALSEGKCTNCLHPIAGVWS